MADAEPAHDLEIDPASIGVGPIFAIFPQILDLAFRSDQKVGDLPDEIKSLIEFPADSSWDEFLNAQIISFSHKTGIYISVSRILDVCETPAAVAVFREEIRDDIDEYNGVRLVRWAIKNHPLLFVKEIETWLEPLLDAGAHNPEERNWLKERRGFNPLYIIRISPQELIDEGLCPILRPQDLREVHLNKLIVIEGMASSVSLAYLEFLVFRFHCILCGSGQLIPNTAESSERLRKTSSGLRPLSCINPNCKSKLFELDTEESLYRDARFAHLMTCPDQADAAMGSDSKRIMLFGALLDSIRPSDRVRVAGVFLPGVFGTLSGTGTSPFVQALGVACSDRFEEPKFSEADIDQIRKLAEDPLIIFRLAISLAPSLRGCDIPKLAAILAILGGVRPPADDSREMIHVLLIGDAGTGKSRILDAASKILPRSMYGSGKSTTGIGLLGCLIQSPVKGDPWTLQAGMLPLATGAVACVDELDKVSPADRDSLHSPLETGVVYVHKADKHDKLPARTALLAAMNPQTQDMVWDNGKSIRSQIGLDTPLLSRFDLIFLLRTVLDASATSAIISSIIGQYTEPGVAPPPGDPDGAPSEDAPAPPEKPREFLSQWAHSLSEAQFGIAGLEPLPDGFLRKYLVYAKRNCFPRLSKEAGMDVEVFVKKIWESASEAKLSGRDTPLIPTPRLAHSIIRISSAIAKARLSESVDPADVELACALFRISMFQLGTLSESEGTLRVNFLPLFGPEKRLTEHDVFSLLLAILPHMASPFSETDLQEKLIALHPKGAISAELFDRAVRMLRSKNIIIETRAPAPRNLVYKKGPK